MTKFTSLIDDIYSILDETSEHEVSEDNLEVLAENIKEHLRKSLGGRRKENKPVLRASKLGLPLRRLYFDIHNPKPVKPSDTLRFLYGNLLEELILFLAREANHNVEDEQKQVKVNGVVGHKDARIDGVTTDVKSASSFSFKKFANGEFLLDDKEGDPFGYKAQLGFYMKASEDTEGAILVVNKESGELCSVLLSQEHGDVPDVLEKIEKAQLALENETPPTQYCYSDEPRGKSGNRVLHKLCTFCPHKFECWKDANDGKGLIEHEYANERVYFTKLVREPKQYGES